MRFEIFQPPRLFRNHEQAPKWPRNQAPEHFYENKKNTQKKSPKVPILNKINNFYTNRPFQKNPHPMKSEGKYTQNILFIESTRCKITRGNPRVKGPRTQTTQRNYGIHATRSLCNAAAFQHRFHGHAGGMWRKTKWETGRNGGTKKRK